jgi:hypothetical protein
MSVYLVLFVAGAARFFNLGSVNVKILATDRSQTFITGVTSVFDVGSKKHR